MPETPDQPQKDSENRKLLFEALKKGSQQPREQYSEEEAVCALLADLADQEKATEPPSPLLLPKDQGERHRLAAAAMRMLEEKGDPRSWEDHLAPQRLLHVILVLDDEGKTGIQPSVPQRVKAAIGCLDREWNEKHGASNSLDAYEERVRQLYRLVNLQVLPEGLRVCQEKLASIEEEMRASHGRAIPEFVRTKLVETKAYETKRQEELQKQVKTAMEVAVPEESPIRAKLKFESDACVYAYADANGKTSHWKLVPHSDDYLCLRCVENDAMIAPLSAKDLCEAMEKDQLDPIIEKAMRDYKGEQDERKRRTLESYDLPASEKIAHVRLFPKTFDKVVLANLHGSMLLSTALQDRYPGRVEARPILFSDAPKKALIEEIQGIYRGGKGPKVFCIDVFNHGTDEALAFQEELTAKDLVDIARQFPDCTFTFGTMACFGGGLREGFLKEFEKPENQELRERVAVFLQTKPHAVAFNAFFRANGRETTMASTNYYYHFIQALYEGKTYGEAARIADIETKKYTPLDAEAVINGELFTLGRRLASQDAAAAA